MISQRVISALAETDISPHLAKAIMAVVEAADELVNHGEMFPDDTREALSELEQALKDAGL